MMMFKGNGKRQILDNVSSKQISIREGRKIDCQTVRILACVFWAEIES